MTISGFKSYEGPTELTFGDPTVITGGNGRGKTSIADAIAFAVTGLPFFGERGIDRLHNESNPDVAIQMYFVDETGAAHKLIRTRKKNRMTITYDGYEIRQLDLTDLFGERDVFLSILNPLYFIEELGEDGKNLLERYLPLIPQEMILAQLAEPVRASLKDEFLLSPDAYLKRRREEIRGLEERITYLGGQRDLAAAQEEQQQKTRIELADQLGGLKAEIAALEEKQFAGLDTARMQERLVELSSCYDEAVQDVRGDASEQQKALQELREKIIRRQAEQYQSKFTQPMAEAYARVNDLGARYQREMASYKAFHAGMDCPVCHRSVTEETLPEVQTALKKVISELYAAGTEQKSQLTELQEMDKKAMELLHVFELDDKADFLASNLPYGDQRKLEIARALATEPKLLLLDEPAAGMNPNETVELMNTIRFVRDNFDMTVLLIEHDMTLVSGICEKLSVLNFGQLLCQGNTSDVLNNPEVITAYLGE